MKTKFTKKMLSLFLAVLMVISALPFSAVTALADDATTATVLNQIGSFQPKRGTAVAHVYSNNRSDVATDGYSNVLWESTAAWKVPYIDKDGTTIKVHVPTTMVLLYDGVNETAIPAQAETLGNGKTGVRNFRVHNVSSLNSTLYFDTVWNGYRDNGWGYWAKDSITTAATFPADGTKNANIYHNMDNKKTSRYWWNKLVYHGPGNTTDYYEKISNIKFQINNGYYYAGQKIGNYEVTASSTYYFINYAPVVTAINKAKAVLKDASASDFCDKEALNAYCSAVKALMDLNVTVNGTGDVATVASNIKTAVNAFNVKAEPAKHNPVSANNSVAATCTEDGKNADTICSKCSATLVEGTKIDKTGHSTSYNATVKIQPTCKTQGTTTYSCKNAGCDYSFDVQDIPVDPNAHNMGKYVANGNATCENDGTETATCQNGCGYSDTRDVTGSATGHAYSTTVANVGDVYTWTTKCANCNDVSATRTVDISGYNSAKAAAEANIAKTDMYTSDSIELLKGKIVALDLADDSELTQDDVNAYATAITTANQVGNGGVLELKSFEVEFVTLNDTTNEETTIEKATYKYGEVVTFKATDIDTPHKWTKTVNDGDDVKDVKIASSTDTVSFVVTEKTKIVATYGVKNTTSNNQKIVTIYNKTNKVVDYLYVKDGDTLTYEANSIKVNGEVKVVMPKVPFYQIIGYKANDASFDSSIVVTENVSLVPIYEAQNAIKITLASEGIAFSHTAEKEISANWDQKITVTSNEAVTWYVDSKAVAKGTSYTFRATNSAVITAETVAEEKGSSTITYSGYSAENNAVRIAASSYQSDSFKIKEQGLIVATSKNAGVTVAKDLLIAKGKKFVASKTTDTKDQFSYTLTITQGSGTRTVCAVSYVVYENGTVCYSDVATIDIQ